MENSQFYYVHDPMCSWCWAHRPQWDQFKKALESRNIPVEYVVGGLAPDSDKPMPEEQKETVSGYWRKIEALLGTPFNHDFWNSATPRRSTYPACRAVIAAKSQQAEEKMIHALQEAYYLRALNPSDVSTHELLAAELGLDVSKFSNELASNELEAEFNRQLRFAHSMPISGFPSMVLKHNDQWHSIVLDYKDYSGALAQVEEILS
ncbi:DsbA family protein [Reinekea marina]|uniref:DsbA family protein n=2 Tax=Reinekea marina TaxID=1310421 RepID=A0ABV7WR46_9GAMM